MNKASQAAARRAVVDGSSISPEKLAAALGIVSEAVENSARATAVTYDMAFLVVGYVSEARQEAPAKANRRRLLKMSRSLASFRDELHGLNSDVRSALNRQLGSDEKYGDAWRILSKSARSLAQKITEFENDFVGRKRSNEDARRLFRNAASVWHKAIGAWPSTATEFVGSSQGAVSPLHELIRDLAEAGAASLPSQERKELLAALSLNCFIEGVRAAKAATRKTGQDTA